jgi:Fe-S cluster biosynthesis and repair protein YggX
MKSKTVEQKKPEKLFKIVDKVLRQIFGETATLFIYQYLEEKYSLKREDIPNELGIFTDGLENYLSHFGASVVLQTLFIESSGLNLTKAEEKKFLKQVKELKRLT